MRLFISSVTAIAMAPAMELACPKHGPGKGKYLDRPSTRHSVSPKPDVGDTETHREKIRQGRPRRRCRRMANAALLTALEITFRGSFREVATARRRDRCSCDRLIAIGALMHQYIYEREK